MHTKRLNHNNKTDKNSNYAQMTRIQVQNQNKQTKETPKKKTYLH